MDILSPLFHYTNVPVLALILKNQTIRFNSLDRMDDHQEQMTADLKNVGQFCYISSWTEDSEESIPMWKMYGSMESGVRISLERNPFQIYTNNLEELSRQTNLSIKWGFDKNPETIIPLSEMLQGDFYSAQAISKDLLHKVEYTSDVNKLLPRLKASNKESTSIALNELGKYKNLKWSFQREWRYIIHAIPMPFTRRITDYGKWGIEFVNDMSSGTAKQPFPFYELKIDKEAFSRMTITLSPNIKPGNRVIVYDLVEKYNPSAKIFESELIGLI